MGNHQTGLLGRVEGLRLWAAGAIALREDSFPFSIEPEVARSNSERLTMDSTLMAFERAPRLN